MIKIEYTQKPYQNCFKDGQEFYENYEIELTEDCSSYEAIVAMCKLLNVATYHVTLETLKNLVKELEKYGYEDKDQIMSCSL